MVIALCVRTCAEHAIQEEFVPSTLLALRLAKALGTTVERLFQLR